MSVDDETVALRLLSDGRLRPNPSCESCRSGSVAKNAARARDPAIFDACLGTMAIYERPDMALYRSNAQPRQQTARLSHRSR